MLTTPTVSYIKNVDVPGMSPEIFQESVFHIEMEFLLCDIEHSSAYRDKMASIIGHEILAHFDKAKPKAKHKP
jgi:hypothetical protein